MSRFHSLTCSSWVSFNTHSQYATHHSRREANSCPSSLENYSANRTPVLELFHYQPHLQQTAVLSTSWINYNHLWKFLYLMIKRNGVCICTAIPIFILQPSHRNNKSAILEVCNFIDVVVAIASIIHRAQHMWINILPPFLHMINLRYNTIPGNHWIVTDIIAYHRTGPVLSRIKHLSLILDGVKTVILRTMATRVCRSFME